ncbi:unnamed protein product, partial [Rotaria magnacalcarata]
ILFPGHSSPLNQLSSSNSFRSVDSNTTSNAQQSVSKDLLNQVLHEDKTSTQATTSNLQQVDKSILEFAFRIAHTLR